MSSIHRFLGLPLFSYLLVSTLVLFWVFFFLPSASHDPAKPFFCFLQISLYLHFFIRSFRILPNLFFFFNRLCNPCGFWPDQLSLSILSRKFFTEWRCQRHVKHPNLEDQWLEPSNSRYREFPASETTQANPSSGRWKGKKFPRILPKVATSTSLLGSFTCRKFTTWDRRLYFPSEGRRAEDFFARKIRRLRPGLNPRTRVPKASTLTSRPPKPLILPN